MDGLTEREKDVLLHLIRNGTKEIRLGDRNEEVSIGVCDDETLPYTQITGFAHVISRTRDLSVLSFG